ncbi:MAG: arsenate reductase ArsC, partial [Gammaproteobacteria bacterium]|nr:arsenate reductase ArsC [Gammaproteobacteria bacterium]NIR95451.1 arsenate reductase ArsC [Gammaproteobacteria bacterium]NIW41598.1 arsenate reductase ArsC [candidate division Zixibacteria bacterium]NIX58373.1 arsenate reductase ArsC [candidate division Zixibacteria bacterium]
MEKLSNTADKPTILLVCTGNSCRSQMAEGLIKHSFGESVKVYSAGSHPAGVVH